MRLTPIFFLLFSILTYSQKTDQKIAEQLKIEGSNVAIFPEDKGDLWFADSRFTPTREEVEKAETALRENLETLNKDLINQDGSKNNPIIHKNLKKYNRQYFGYIDENGDRILLINGLWNKIEPISSWLNEWIVVFDGGSYYWNIKFNLTTGKLFDLSVNGNA